MRFDLSFNDTLAKRRMSLDELSERSEIAKGKIEDAQAGKFELSDEEVERIAEELGVPARALFGTVELPLSNLPDFRRRVPTSRLLDKTTIGALAYVEKISLSLASLDLDLGLSRKAEKYTGPLNKGAAEKLAEVWRDRWGLSEEDQLEWKAASRVYASLREFVESLGIFVVHYSFGSDEIAGLYAKMDGGPHTILVNTSSSSKARKLFTLAHEFCHVLLREVGISNTAIARNSIEVFCNQFAAFLIAPAKLVKLAVSRYKYNIALDGSSIRLLAQNLGISQQACVLRLVDLEYLKSDDYGRWIMRFKGRIPDGDREDKGGGNSESDPIKNKRTQYGSSFLARLSEARRAGMLDAIEIYRLAGIKPKYQRELLGGV
jgi:Zn-dependent peptidase ImmA (M78 family)